MAVSSLKRRDIHRMTWISNDEEPRNDHIATRKIHLVQWRTSERAADTEHKLTTDKLQLHVREYKAEYKAENTPGSRESFTQRRSRSPQMSHLSLESIWMKVPISICAEKLQKSIPHQTKN